MTEREKSACMEVKKKEIIANPGKVTRIGRRGLKEGSEEGLALRTIALL